MAKVRVYELAKELGVESKVVLAKLQDMGEFVRSASSTVEPPVVRKLKEVFPAQPAGEAAPAKKTTKKAAAKKAAPAEPMTAGAESAAQPVAVAAPEAPVVASPAPPAIPAPEAPVAEPAAEAPARPAGPRPGNNPFTSKDAGAARPAARVLATTPSPAGTPASLVRPPRGRAVPDPTRA